jgi:hypothetical protein
MSPRRRGFGFWLLAAGATAVTLVLVLQKTKQAMLPAAQTRVLWAAEGATLAAAAVLLSGWGRGAGWTDAQRRLGAIVNDYYAPRRDAFVSSGAVAGGVLGGLWWALATWAVVLGGMRRGSMERGLLDFEVAALVGAVTGGAVGAVLGLAAGQVWETRHRRRRERMLAERSTNA